ncbi:IS110 family transposase [Aquisalimonas sp. 2447]|uniref:IS110 family transposase n=1 Tax=Aquisalimonas sp. 2447 TaxID=2740807 RepID=UPI0014323162|nr:IS110 family transposase [Aquisalimonas sp. 2447]QIT55927.1 IS110 family transposase [Aquisalimonas sp. 2447]
MAGKRQKRRLEVVHPDCAGIDVGGHEHWVAVDPGRCEVSVRCFSGFTDDLQALADWLESLGITQVAMEATGVYWIAPFEVLDARGFEVLLVNSRATRQVSGRKSDVLDCQWIWQLMSHGLLSGAFRPGDAVCTLRAFVRQRSRRIQAQSWCLNHMHKALAQMNVHLGHVVSDLKGKTAMRILRAIVAGERDPWQLATLRDRRLRADEATVARSLHGNWRVEHLFALEQALAHFDFLEQQIGACDRAILSALEALPVRACAPTELATPSRSAHRSAAEQRRLQQALVQAMGVDLSAIPSLGVDTVLVIAGEIGPDLSRFPSQAHFCSWLGLAPPTRISGGKALSGPGTKVNNIAAQALRQAASNARSSRSFIGAAHRARLTRMDTAKAIKATAHQLARLIYAMLTRGQPYVEKSIEAFETTRHDRQLRALQRKARKLGLDLVPAA